MIFNRILALHVPLGRRWGVGIDLRFAAYRCT
jgi:hypothetical protein